MPEEATQTAVEQVQDTAATPAPEESAAPESETPNPSDDRAVFNSIMREGAKTQDAEDQPDDAVEASDEKPEGESESEADEKAQPEADKPTGDAQVAKYIKDLKLKEDEAFDVALSALKRSGIFDESELDSMYQSDSKAFLAKGLKLAKTQRDSDAYAAKLRDEARKAKPAEQPKPEPAKSASLDELKAVVSTKLKPLAETFDAETAATIESAINAMAEQLAGSVTSKDAELAEANKRFEQVQYQMVEMRLSNARRDLQARYPELSNGDVYQRVLDKYDTLAATSKFKTVEEAFSEAARWELGEQSTDDIKNRLLRNSAQRKAGQPRADTPRVAERAMTPEDKERLEFNRLHKKHMGAFSE